MSLGLGTRAILKLDEIREGIKACGQGAGSGGGGDGCVIDITLPGLRHLFPSHNVIITAEAYATCLAIRKKGYRVDERDWEEQRQPMSKRDHVAVSQEWYEILKSVIAK